jgi:hypothetical protein
MAQIFDGQHEDESVELVFHQHPIVLRKPLIIFSIVMLLGALPLAFWPTESWAWISFGLGILAGAVTFAYFWMSWYFSLYIITDQRIVHIEQRGFFHRQVVELGHDKIQNVNYEIPGMWATLFHYGTIVVQTYVGDLVLETIYKPEKVHRGISEIVREHAPAPGEGILS